MKLADSNNELPAGPEKLRNFDLSVEEIRILKSIRDLTQSVEDMERKNASTERLEYFRCQIRQLNDQLDEIRENTLIR